LKKILYLILFNLSFPITGQTLNSEYNNQFSFRFDNDFVSQTDEYFTNGLKLSYSSTWLKDSPINLLFPDISSNSNYFYEINLQQNIYTPSDFSHPDTNFYDRPFAGFLLLGEKRKEFTSELKLISEFQFRIGILGKNAFAEEVQNGIHSILPTSGHVLGWEYQIADELIANYSFSFEKNLINILGLDLNLLSGAEIGLPFTKSDFGMKLLFSMNDDYYNSEKLSVDGEFEFRAFLASKINLVLYDGTIQGGFSNKSPFTLKNINSLVYDLEIGTSLAIGKTVLDLGYIYNSPTVKITKHHRWGYINLKYWF